MNTRFSMVLVDVDGEEAELLAAAVERELYDCERLMSRFDWNSPVSELNRSAAERSVMPPEQLWEILVLCRRYWQQTRGAFDITIQPLIDLWRERAERGVEPSAERIEEARERTGFERIDFDTENRAVRFRAEGMSVDLGGFGKGFALDRAAASLRAAGVRQAFLSFGESSIAVLGAHPNGPDWPVGIPNLFRPAEMLWSFHLKDASLSTSGTAPFNRLAEIPASGSRALGQTIDPRTGCPVSGYRTMSVAAPDGAGAEALSTALLVIPEPEREAILAAFPGSSAVEIVYDSSTEEFMPRISWKYGL